MYAKIIPFIFVLIFFSCNQIGDKKNIAEKSLKGTVLFSLGDVTVLDKNSQKKPLGVQNIVVSGQTIITGPRSFVTIQIGTIAVIKIKENSKLLYNAIASDVITSMNLQNGVLLSKVNKLQKGQKFTVYTNTILAAVRGTEFQISSTDKKTKIALRQGKLALKIISNTGKDEIKKKILDKKDDVILNQGKTVTAEPKQDKKFLDNNDIKETAITVSENLEIEKISIVPVVKDPQKITKEELKKIEKETIQKENEIDKKLIKAQNKDKINSILQKKVRSVVDLKKVSHRVSRFKLWNSRVVVGAVVQNRSDYLVVETTYGREKILKKDIKNENPL